MRRAHHDRGHLPHGGRRPHDAGFDRWDPPDRPRHVHGVVPGDPGGHRRPGRRPGRIVRRGGPVQGRPLRSGSREIPDKEHVKERFRELRDTGDPAIRQELIEVHLGLVEYLARRFAGRGEPLDDLIQVATIGLVKAVDRFDPAREVEFSTYATPTIVGELKRHFRDKGWAVRIPRRLQELNLRLGTIVAELSQQGGRSPTVAEIAGAANTTEEEVLEAMDSAHAYNLVSLDAAPGDEGLSLHEQLGEEDETLDLLEYRASLAPLLEELPPRERRMLYLRFFKGMTQSEIAQQLGISQMHVSRLLARTLATLRDRLEG
ncbi:MAG: RNA polymerase sigma factor SigF [Actinobacteria bacterium]|nr:RNA polymerase sigma factor SigF [Actinomycetota bacterium]